VACAVSPGWLGALAPAARRDRGRRRFPDELVALIEGMALRRPAPSIAHVHRQAVTAAAARDWPAPSYSTVRAIVAAIDPGMATLAHEGPVRYRERFELVCRREAERPNHTWQADHTQLDLVILDAAGRPARPWLTVILDDQSRALAGYTRLAGGAGTP
jgi:putative transposase